MQLKVAHLFRTGPADVCEVRTAGVRMVADGGVRGVAAADVCEMATKRWADRVRHVRVG